jgi:hypothetical protein
MVVLATWMEIDGSSTMVMHKVVAGRDQVEQVIVAQTQSPSVAQTRNSKYISWPARISTHTMVISGCYPHHYLIITSAQEAVT